MTASAFDKRNGTFPFAGTYFARGVLLVWLAALCLVLSSYGGPEISMAPKQHPQELAALEHADGAVHASECDGGVVCSAFILPATDSGIGQLARRLDDVASNHPLAQLRSPKIDPPPPRRFG